MSLPRISASLAALLALVATDSAAAPTAAGAKPIPRTQGPKAAAECPTPDEQQCLAKGYLDSRCGQRHLDVCKPFAEDAMKAHYEASTVPKLKMLRPKKTDMPKHVKRGKYFAYEKKRVFKKKGSVPTARKMYEKTNDVLEGMSGKRMSSTPPVDRVTTVDPNTAAQFHREPAWKANGNAVRSCREYAYARSYGVTRFVDAASACKGDRECVFDVAYMRNPPGIANRKIKNEDGIAISQLDLPVGQFQKNDFFAPDMHEFVRVNGERPIGATADTNALEEALRDGADFYDIGRCDGAACNNTRRFEDVWDWHEYLHGRTTAVSQAEAEEYERRRAQLRGLLEQWAAAVNREAGMLNQRPEEDALVLPFDMRAHDPFDRYRIEEEYIERGRTEMQRLRRKFGPSILRKNIDEAVRHVNASSSLAVGVLAAPMKPATKSTKVPKSAAGEAGQNDNGVQSNPCARADGWGLETGKRGPISCRIGLFLRNEWARMKSGQRSCLDLANPACDWTPQMFDAGILEKIPKLDAQVADQAYCEAYDDPGIFDDRDGQVATVTLVKNRLDANKRRREKELKAVSDYITGAGDVGVQLGKGWEGGDYVGDKDLFAAGYEYELGWVAEPAQQDAGAVCALKGSAHAEMAFDAWIVGSKASVVDGAVWAEAKPGLQGDGNVNAHLRMFGASVFNTNGWKLTQEFGDEPASDMGVELPSPKPRFDIYVGVPISGQLWGELLYGSTLDVKASSPTGCNADQPFAIRATFAPFFGAFGFGKVGVGIAGVASAGIRASLNLLMMSLPVEIGMRRTTKDNRPTLSFDSELSLMLSTLSGRVSLYVEFLMFEEEFELFRWKGFHAETPIMPKLTANVSLDALLR